MPPHHRQVTLKLRANYVDYCLRDYRRRNGNDSPHEDEGKPHEPTQHLPGTRQKIEIMSVRAAMGLPIFLPGDVRLNPGLA